MGVEKFNIRGKIGGLSVTENYELKTDETEVARLVRRVDELVQLRASMGRSVYYLSALGNDLGSDKQVIQEKLSLPLMQFVQKHTNHQLKAFGVHKNVYGIVFSDFGSDPSISDIPQMRFRRGLWAAFVYGDGLDPTTRFINLKTLQFSSDQDSIRSEGDAILTVGPDYQVRWSDPNKHSLVYEKILRWLRENSLSPEQFLESPAESKRKAIHGSLLETIIDALSPEQRRRFVLPMDVVATLLGKRE